MKYCGLTFVQSFHERIFVTVGLSNIVIRMNHNYFIIIIISFVITILIAIPVITMLTVLIMMYICLTTFSVTQGL